MNFLASIEFVYVIFLIKRTGSSTVITHGNKLETLKLLILCHCWGWDIIIRAIGIFKAAIGTVTRIKYHYNHFIGGPSSVEAHLSHLPSICHQIRSLPFIAPNVRLIHLKVGC